KWPSVLLFFIGCLVFIVESVRLNYLQISTLGSRVLMPVRCGRTVDLAATADSRTVEVPVERSFHDAFCTRDPRPRPSRILARRGSSHPRAGGGRRAARVRDDLGRRLPRGRPARTRGHPRRHRDGGRGDGHREHLEGTGGRGGRIVPPPGG